MNMLPLLIALPLGAAMLLPILDRMSRKVADILANLVNLALLIISVLLLLGHNYPLVYEVGGWAPVDGIPIGIYMVLDGLSSLMLVMVNLVGFLASLYSIQYMERYTEKTKYYTLFLLLMAGMNGVILSGDMFNMFVFLEVAAIASYALVAFGTEAEELEAAFKYQVMGTVASGLILLGIAILYSFSGTLNMADMAGIISQKGINSVVLFAGALFITGFGLKAAIMPFHAWLPDAHPSAPAPISAMLSGVLIKAIGVYALCRILFNVTGLGDTRLVLTILLAMGTISMVAGGLLALGQKDFKRLLAYSSISQIGYIIFALGLGTELGYLGAILHLLNHAVSKSLLFLNAGAVVYATDNRDLERMGGLSRKMPITGTTCLVGSLSISGIPIVGGFWSKLIIIIAAVQARYFALAWVAVLMSIITLAYYLKVQRMAFFGPTRADKTEESERPIREVPGLMCVSMITLAILSFCMGILLVPPIREFVLSPAVEVLSNGVQYARNVLGN